LENEESNNTKKLINTDIKNYTELYFFAPSGYITLDKNGCIVELNYAAALIFAKDRLSLLNCKLDFFITESTKSDFNNFLEKVFFRKSKQKCNVIIISEGNLQIHTRIEGVLSPNGEQCYLTLFDISELITSNDLNQILLNSLPYPSMYIIKKDRTVIAANTQALKLGVKIGGHCWRAFENTNNFLPKHKKIIEEYPELVPAEFSVKCSFCLGDQCIVEHPIQNISNVNLMDSIWDISWIKVQEDVYLHYMVDVTKIKQAELTIQEQNKALIKLNDDKDRFISIIAHDLRSPFNYIIGFLELLIENIRTYDIDKLEYQLNIVNKTVLNLYDFLEDLLLWASIQSGKLPFIPLKINFATICDEIHALLQQNASAKDITINHFAEDDIYIVADVNLIKTVLRNLVSNAIKYTNTGGTVNLYAEIDDNNVSITVSDNGIGIEPNKLDTLFDFAHVKPTRGTAKEKGSGLGLVLCKEFVEMHGGKIWAESKLGIGSKFIFTLPLKIQTNNYKS
jgi:signal transduction histidine kinase